MGTGYSIVVEVLVGEFGCLEGDLMPETTMEDVDLDSLSQVEFAVALERRTGLPFSHDQVTLDTTLSQVAAAIDGAYASGAEVTAP
ncbi:acyl carrier protein [Streptomyces sp. SudanB182_2057]|uniref:acyl carrier protein n=1 Tax=Streptomyces sp. SudanB182_2057 TaxID=3035281 RepID=UPI003F54AE91